MVEDKIIIHENKRNYLLLIIGFALCFLAISMPFGYSLINIVFNQILQKNDALMFDFLKFSGYFGVTISVFSWMVSIPGIIICFIKGRKILIKKRFSVAVFVILLVTGLLRLIGNFSNASSYTSGYSVVCSILYLTVVVLLFVICIRNNILSKLLLIGLILFAVNNVFGIVSPFMYKGISNGFITAFSKITVSQYFIILNYLRLIGNYFKFAGFILCLIYLIRCVDKNNVFNKSSKNKLVSTLILVVPSLVIVSFICTIYLVCFFVLTTI